MKVDLSKNEYTLDEKKIMSLETEYLKERNPDHIPILIQLDSNVLNIDKRKFLVSDDITFKDFIDNTLKKKLINLYSNDVITIYSIKSDKIIELKPQLKPMSQMYLEYKDPETNLLILRIKRNTTYKSIKDYVKYFYGY